MRYIGIIGDGIYSTHYLIAEMQRETPTQALVLKSTKSEVLFSGFVFCNSRWYLDIDPNSNGRGEKIDEFLSFLVTRSVDSTDSKNLRLIRDYLNNKPQSLNDCILRWQSFFDGSFNSY